MKELDLKDNYSAFAIALIFEEVTAQKAIDIVINRKSVEVKPKKQGYNPNGKITEADVQNMIRLRESTEENWTFDRIGTMYGIEGNTARVHIEQYREYLANKEVSA